MGQAESAASIENVNITYTVNHTHGDYCYPEATWEDGYFTESHRDSDLNAGDGDNIHYYNYYIKCTGCGQYTGATAVDSGHYYTKAAQCRQAAKNKAILQYKANHLRGGVCPYAGYKCGKEEGECKVTDVKQLGSGDEVLSATIEF